MAVFVAIGEIFSGFEQNQQTINRQSVTNKFASINNEICMTWGSADASNNVVIVNNSTTGNITIQASAQADMTCLLNQQSNTSISNVLGSQSQQQTSQNNGLFSFLENGNTNDNNVNIQTVYNSITSINNSVCSSTAQSTADNNIMVYNQATTGDIYIDANAPAVSSCNANNIISAESYNGLGNTSNQQSTTRTVMTTIVIGIVAIVIVIGIVLALSMVGKSMASASANKNQDSLTQQLETIS